MSFAKELIDATYEKYSHEIKEIKEQCKEAAEKGEYEIRYWVSYDDRQKLKILDRYCEKELGLKVLWSDYNLIISW